MVKQEFNPNARVHWMEGEKAVRVEWLKLFMSLEQFQAICGIAIQVLRQNGGDIWIADQFNSEGAFPKDIQAFIIEELEPIAIAAGIKKILTVVPKELGLSSMSTNRWNANVAAKGNFITKKFNSLEACTDWLSHQP